jgi:hypothetical protein
MVDTRDIVERLRDPLQPKGDYCDSIQCDKDKEEAAAQIISLRKCLAKVVYAHVTGEPLSPTLEALAKAFITEVCGEQLHTAAGVAVKEVGCE